MVPTTIRQLEIFVQAVEYRSFRKCAEAIGISQVAVSDHIRALEAQMGKALFERRTGAPATLNALGRRVYRRARSVLAEFAALHLEAASREDALPTNEIVIAGHGYIVEALHDWAAAITAAQSDVTLRFRTDFRTMEDMRSGLIDGSLHMAWFFALDDPGLFPSSFYAYEPWGLYVGAGHRLAGRPALDTQDILEHGAVVPLANHYLRHVFDATMRRMGLGKLKVALETDDYGLVLSRLRRGHGFGCLAEGRRPAPELEGLVRLDLKRPLPSLQIRYAVSPLIAELPIAAALTAALPSEN